MKKGKETFKNCSNHFNECTTINYKTKMIIIFGKYNIKYNDFKKESIYEENIILKNKRINYFDSKKIISFTSTKYTRNLQREMDEINNFISKYNICYKKENYKYTFSSKNRLGSIFLS